MLSNSEARHLISAVLDASPDHDEELRFDARAFKNMLDRFEADELYLPSSKQAAWIKNVYEKIIGAPQYENLMSEGKAPRGREVEAPPCLRPENLPKKPPGRT